MTREGASYRRRRGEVSSEVRGSALTLRFPTRAERTGRQPHIASLQARVWPEFMYHDAVLDRLFGRVVDEYSEFRFCARRPTVFRSDV